MVRSFEIEHGCVLKTDLEDNPISVYPIPLQLPLFLFFLPCTFFVPSRPAYLFLSLFLKKNCSSFYFVLSLFPFQGNWSYIPKCRSKGRKRALPRSRVKYVNRLTRERKDAFRRGRNAGALDPTDRFPRRRNRTFSSFAIDKKTSSTTINLFLLYERFPSFLFTWKPSEKKSLLIHMPVIMYFIRYTHMLIHKTHVHTLMYLLRMSRVILSVVSILMIANHPLVENDQ